MKFHCDRCKTKYSISDDRVRGKILKIRCKNCSAVITVREGGAAAESPDAAAAAKPAEKAGQEALAGAFKKSVTEGNSAPGHVAPGQSGSSEPPVSLAAEWYVSIDGEQEGPFSLEQARTWVQDKPADAELHCWSEGYDDWLPVDKVSHFRKLRRAASAPAAPGLEEPTVPSETAPAGDEDTPMPLFAATMAAVEQRASAADSEPAKPVTGPFDAIAQAQPRAASAPPIPTANAAAKPAVGKPAPSFNEEGASLEFDIGEASRVVDLPALMASRGNAPVRPKGNIHAPGLPGMGGGSEEAGNLGRGSGPQSAIPGVAPSNGSGSLVALSGGTPVGSVALDADSPVLEPQSRKKRGGLLLPLIGVGAVIAVVAVVMVIMVGGDDESSQVARGSVGGSAGLGYSYEDTRRTREPGTQTEVVPEETSPRTKTTVRRKNPVAGTTQPKGKVTSLPKLPNDPEEVDLGGSASTEPTGPLDGDDLMRVYRRNQIAIKMCYERELKKNPLLKLPKTWVDIKVGLDGRVSGVSIPSLSGTPLGTCMRSRIARWKFRKTTETFSSRFPVVFGS